MASREKMLNRKLFMIPDSLQQKIQDFRFARRFDTEAQALRFLIERGLEIEGWADTEPHVEERVLSPYATSAKPN